MADFEARLINLRVLGVAVLTASLIFLAIGLIGTLASGGDGTWGLALVISIPSAIIGFAYYGLTRLLLAVEANTYHLEETLQRLLRRHDQLVERVDALNENILLSEDAKAIAFRGKDRQALRQAITEEIAARDWESALYLIDQMEKRFGYRQEADQFRQQTIQMRQAERQNDLAMALAKFEDALNAYDWEGAVREMESLVKMFPEAPETSTLQERLEETRTARKKWLLGQWDEAVQRNEVDHGIELLKELDQYLTASEVAALEESARGVFRAKLHNLGIQFSLLVTEKLWDRALGVAEEIVSEFPNSRMSQEIRERLDTLRTKAQGMKGT